MAVQDGRAAQAVALVLVDPDLAQRLAVDVIAEAPDDASVAHANRAMAVLALHRGERLLAAEHADLAVQAAGRCGNGEVLGAALMTRMGVFITSGEAQRAVTDSHRAEPLVSASDRPRLLIQRGTAFGTGLGNARAAIETYDTVEREHPDLEPVVRCVLWMNRGTQLAISDRHVEAIADFSRARAVYRDVGNLAAEADVVLHEAKSAAALGDVPGVFALHEEIAERGLFDTSDARVHNDLSGALELVGLRREAKRWAEFGVAATHRTHVVAASVEVALRLAAFARAEGDPAGADAHVAQAQAWAEELGSDWLRLLSRLERTRLQEAFDGAAGDLGDAYLAVAAELRDLGRLNDAQEVELIAAGHLLAHDPTRVAAVVAEQAGQRPRDPRSQARVAQAKVMRAVAEGDDRLALTHAAQGLRAIEQMRAGIGDLELRASASDRGPELARLVLPLTLHRAPRHMFDWVERQRAVSLRLVAPTRVSERGRTARQTDTVAGRPSVREVVSHAGSGVVLISFVEIEGELYRLRIQSGRVSRSPCSLALDDVQRLTHRATFGLRRQALGGPAVASGAGAADSGATEDLGEALLGGVDLDHHDLDVVIVPSAGLRQVPWGVLPHLQERVFVVAPSAASWLLAERRAGGPGRRSSVLGPRLPAALDEVRALGDGHDGRPDTVEEALRALDGARVGHIAAHGRFRADNALMSSIELADGSLFVDDLAALPAVPQVLVLSACSIGAVDVLDGDEVLGFPTAALAAGARSVIACPYAVDDEAAKDIMIRFHDRLRAGDGPARALAEVRVTARELGETQRAVAASFACFGAR